MQWIVLADVHGSVRYLPSIVPELSQAAGVFIAGDITNFGGAEEAARIIDSIAAVNDNILAVAGNCDLKGVEQCLEERGMGLHCKAKVQGALCCAGANGLPSHEQGEASVMRLLEEVVQPHHASALVVVTHQPAYATGVDGLRGSRYSGSRALRQFIESQEPLLAISGHVHEAAGVDRLGKTTLVNPGPFGAGHYAVVTFEQDQVTAQLKHLD